MTIFQYFQQIKSALNGKRATTIDERGDHTYEVFLFEKIIQTHKDGELSYNVGFFDDNLDVNWNANTSTLIMPGGDYIPGHGKRRGEIKFVHDPEKNNTISVVTERVIGYYKMTWFYDRSVLTATV